MVCSTAAVPLPIREREMVVERAADIAQLGRRKEAANHDEMFPVPETLVFQLPSELTH